jgi:hypothetical protein
VYGRVASNRYTSPAERAHDPGSGEDTDRPRKRISGEIGDEEAADPALDSADSAAPVNPTQTIDRVSLRNHEESAWTVVVAAAGCLAAAAPKPRF